MKVYQYTAGFLHAKTVTVDGRWCIIGTCNFDVRSTILHDEVSCVIFDKAVAADYAAIYEDDLRALPRVHDRRLVGAGRWTRWAQLVRAAVLALL